MSKWKTRSSLHTPSGTWANNVTQHKYGRLRTGATQQKTNLPLGASQSERKAFIISLYRCISSLGRISASAWLCSDLFGLDLRTSRLEHRSRWAKEDRLKKTDRYRRIYATSTEIYNSVWQRSTSLHSTSVESNTVDTSHAIYTHAWQLIGSNYFTSAAIYVMTAGR